MAAKIVPFRPQPRRPPSLAELVERVRGFASRGSIGFDHPHFQERMAQRGVTMRQVLEVLKNGQGVSGPTLDPWGDWRIKLKRTVAGRRVQVVVAVRQDGAVAVTVI